MPEDNISLDPYYASQLDNFDDEIDMCNQLGLNLDEIYDYSSYDKE